MTLPRLLPLAVALLLTSCIGELANLVALQKDLIAEYPGTEIAVSVKERNHVQIALRNGIGVDTADEERAELAREVGRFVIAHYPHAELLEAISVTFGTSERAGPVGLTNDLEHFSFTPAELQAPNEPPARELVESAQGAT